MRQIGLGFLKDYKNEFGGSLNLGKRKSKRPLSTKAPIHLILKSTQYSYFNPNFKRIANLIRSECERFDIRVYDFSLNWSHIHLLIKISSRDSYNRFIRSLTSKIVYALTQLAKSKLTRLFDLRPYTKIISWGRQFKSALIYQKLNQAEASGGIEHRELIKTIINMT